MPKSLSNDLFQVTVLTDAATAQVEAARAKWESTATKEEREQVRLGRQPGPSVALGLPYYFHLDGHVDSDEFAVPFDALVAACESAGLTLVSSGELGRPHSLRMMDWFGDRTKIKALGNDTDLSDNERALVTLYRTFCFEKKSA